VQWTCVEETAAGCQLLPLDLWGEGPFELSGRHCAPKSWKVCDSRFSGAAVVPAAVTPAIRHVNPSLPLSLPKWNARGVVLGKTG